MRRVLLALLAAVLVAPSASAAVDGPERTVEVSAAGPDTNLRYAERFRVGEDWKQTTRIVTIDDPTRVRDGRGLEREAIPITVQRRSNGEVLQAERCFAHAETFTAVRREPITTTRFESPLERAWTLNAGSPSEIFSPLPQWWDAEETQALFDPRPCPARGPGTTIDLQTPASVPIESFLPSGLPISDDTRIEADVRTADGTFHGRPAMWVNASFTLELPGPLPASNGTSEPGPLHVDGETHTLWAHGIPGPAKRSVELDLEAPLADGYSAELAWETELTGYEPGTTHEVIETSSTPEPKQTYPWTHRGPRTTSYDVAFPLETAIATLEERGLRYNAFRAQHPDAFLASATFQAHTTPAPLDRAPGEGPVQGPAWTVQFNAPSGDRYEGGVLETLGLDPAKGDAPRHVGASSQTENESARHAHVWEAPPGNSEGPPDQSLQLTKIGPLATGLIVHERLDRLGFPQTPLERLEFHLGPREAASGTQVTVGLAAAYQTPPVGTHAETVQAIVDGETGRVLAISESRLDDERIQLPPPVPATLQQDDGRSATDATAGLPEGPAEGAALAGAIAAFWLLVLVAKAAVASLYTRLSREELLDNPTRETLLAAIREDPGIHLAGLIEQSGVGNGATRHHLDKLEEAGLVCSFKHGGFVRYFPSGEFTETEARRQAALRAGSNREVYEAYLDDPGQSIREIARRVELSTSSVHRALQELRGVDLVDEHDA